MSDDQTNWVEQLEKYKVDPAVKAKEREEFNFRPFKEAPISKTSQDDVVGLEAIDFGKFVEGPEGLESRKKLAAQLESAVVSNGFFKIINFGIPQERIDELLSISQGAFDQPDEIQEQFVGGTHDLPEEKGRCLGSIRGHGYKPRGYWKWDNGTPDNIDIFNMRNFTHFDTFFNRQNYPDFIKYNLDDIAYYFNFIHREVLRKVANLLDLILELPEGHLWENYFKVHPEEIRHSPDGFARFLLYHPVSEEYNEKAHKIWMNGHTDGGSLTFILSQPILSLQICDHDTGKWRYVSHTPGALIVNIADQIFQLTGGYFKSSVHRVITAPDDQKNYARNTAIYFSKVNPDVFIDPDALQSPKLTRLGIRTDNSVPRVTAGEWDDLKGQYFNKDNEDWEKKTTILGRDSIGTLETDKKVAVNPV